MDQQNFQSLLPKDDVNLCNYQAALDYAMEHDEIRNVALSGSYSSGKSSVINSYKRLRTTKKFLHISLADFDKEGELVSPKDTVCSVFTQYDSTHGKRLRQPCLPARWQTS